MKFFEIIADHIKYPKQWFLSEPLDARGDAIDSRAFIAGARYEGPVPTVVPIGNPGQELAFNFGAFDMPVVSTLVANIIQHAAPNDVQCFPVTIRGARDSYQILNLSWKLDCLDESRSEFTRWKIEHGREDKVGDYQSISVLRVDPSRTDRRHLFRLSRYIIPPLVSEPIKDALSFVPSLGVVFRPAS